MTFFLQILFNTLLTFSNDINKFCDVMSSTLKARRESILNERLFALEGTMFRKSYKSFFFLRRNY